MFGYGAAQSCPSSCCRWFGTAPICSGVCPPGCSERARNNIGDGATCFIGSKALCDCCNIGRPTCAWYGTAPLCSGECPSGYRIVMGDMRGDGEVCLTGIKVLCARPGGTCQVCRPTSVQVDNTILGGLTYCRYYSGSQLCAIRVCGILGQVTLDLPPTIPVAG
jgi:hypothetical protein